MSYNREDSESPTIAIDNGSSMCMMGFAGEEMPTSIFRSCVGRPLHKSDLTQDDCFISDKAQERRDVLSLSYPVERGIVTNWDDMEKVWNHCFSHLKADLTEHAIITSEPPLNPRANSEKMIEVMFETYGVPAFHLGYEPDHILFAYGRGSGVMVSIGHGVSYAASIYESYGPMSEQRIDFGGVDLTMKLQKLLFERGYNFTSSSELEELSEIKDKACRVRCKDPSSSDLEKACEFTLPDGTMLNLASERYACSEILFHSDGESNTGPSIPDMICSCLQEGCSSTRPDLYVNILVSGGTSLIPGFESRLTEELRERLPKPMKVRPKFGPERRYSSWIGKSIHGSLSYFRDSCLSKEAYEEYGPQLVHGRFGRTLVRKNYFEEN